MTDDADRLWRALHHPAARALASAAVIAGFAIYAGKRFSSPEGRRSYFEEVRKAAAERREHDAWHERQAQRYRAKTDYFGGRGGQLWRERALVVIGPEKPFLDASFGYRPSGFRQTSFAIESRSAGATLAVGYDAADRTGGLLLTLDDGRKWSLGIWAEQHDLRQYDSTKELPDVEMARLACRLLATPECPFSTITLVRPEAPEIREQIWRDHVAEHPELEEEDWPFR